MVGLNIECTHHVETKKLNVHNNQGNALYSAQTKVYLIDNFFLCVWMDLTMITPSPNFGVVDTIDQEHSVM